MNMAGPLSASDLATFKELGYVIVRDFFPLPVIDSWREQVWAATTCGAEDWPDTVDGRWRGRYSGSQTSGGGRNAGIFTPEASGRLTYPFPDQTTAADPFPVRPTVAQEPHAQAAIDQLLGAGTWGAGIGAPGDTGHGFENDVVVCNWPGQHAPGVKQWHKPHVEGFRPDSKGGPVCRWFVGMTLYLDDVGPGGGSTYVWPKSHQAVHRYYKQYPIDIPSGGALNDKQPEPTRGLSRTANAEGMSSQFMDTACGGYQETPHEAAMNAGDLLIWHHWCVHASSTNTSDRVRQAIITRFHTTAFGDEQRNDAGGAATDGDLWKYWGTAVRGAPRAEDAKL